MMLKRFNFQLLLVVAIVVLAAFLRLYALDQVPPAPYWEEPGLGYDAYSIAETGRDHHGNWLPIVAFESFGDWKPGGYIYLLVPLIKLFGLSVWTVRLPAALAGILIVVAMGQLAGLVEATTTKATKNTSWLPLLVMALTAISPWAIQFSRAAWEVNVAVAMILWGVVIAWRVIQGQIARWYFIVTAVLLVLSTYTYHAARIVAPVLGLALVVCWWLVSQKSFFTKSSLFKSGAKSVQIFVREHFLVLISTLVLSLVLLAPFILSLGSPVTSQRFAETSILSTPLPPETLNPSANIVDRLFNHRYLFYGKMITTHFLSHFNLKYLIMSGDNNPRHSLQFMGLLYHVELVFVLLGVYVLLKKRSVFAGFLIFWLIAGILPASITMSAPHALRTLVTLPVYMILIGWGIKEAFELLQGLVEKITTFFGLKSRLSATFATTTIIGLFMGIYVLELSLFWRFYTMVYPKLYSFEWQYGYEEVMQKVEVLHRQEPEAEIAISREYGRPAMYYWFYTKVDPRLVQAADAASPQDQSEFLEFANFTFIRDTSELKPETDIAVLTAEGADKVASGSSAFTVIDEVRDLRNRPLWKILRRN